MDPIIFLFLFFSFLGVLLSLLFFFKKKGDRFANILLAIYTFLFATELLNNSLRWSGLIKTEKFVHLNLIHFPLWLVYGPLVFIYVRRVISKTAFKITDILFLVPPLVLMGLLFPFYTLSTMNKLNVVNNEKTFDYILLPSYGIWIIIAFMFFYGGYTYFSFWKNRGIGFRENNWLKWFVGCYFGFVFAFTLYIFLITFQLMDPKYDYFVDIIIVLFIGMLAFFGFVQPEVFEGKSIKEVLPFKKYRKTGLSKALSLEMKNKLIGLMENKKLFLNNELRLTHVAEALNLSRNHASQIINEHFNLSFFDFINQYRIEEAKKLLSGNSRRERNTIEQIAYDVGFNNRASFYKAFKKFTGEVPTKYMGETELVS